MPLGLAGLRELIRRRPPPPPPVRPFYSNFDWLSPVRPFYSNFDWLEGLASCPATNLLQYLAWLPVRRTACLPRPPVFLRPTFPFLLGAACWARPERHFDTIIITGYEPKYYVLIV
jgi:hypothetical protein